MTPCPPDEQLTALLADGLTEAERDAVARHVEGCAACQGRLADLTGGDAETWLRAGRPEPGCAAEEGVVHRLKRRAPAGGEAATEQAGPRPRAGTDWGWPAVPGYEILSELGRGGMGVVYQARHLALNRLVALKMVLAGPHAGPRELGRFRAEAGVIARLQHPNIVQIYDVGEVAGRPYFVLEFVAGGSLAQHLDGTPQPPRPAARLVETLARAVHAAHATGVVHRDLKPANVLLQEDVSRRDATEERKERQEENTQLEKSGSSWRSLRLPSASLRATLLSPKITDFGVAKCAEGDGEGPCLGGLTVTGEILGTPNYMAPEQAAVPRQPVGPAADVYALGAILYECLTGRPPFKAATALDTILQVLHTEPVSVTSLQPSVPRDLETVCLKCLHKEPARRYASAAELADDLGRFRDGQPIRARPPSALYRWGKFARRNKALVAAVGGVLAALAVGAVAAGLFALGEAEQRRRADQARDAALRQAYYARLAAAGAALRDDDVSAAARHLEDTERCLRGWEWHHLASRLDESAAVFPPPDHGQMLLADGENGLRLLAVGPDDPRLLDPDSGEGLTPPWKGLVWIHHVEHTARGVRVFGRDASGDLVWLDETGKVRLRLEPPPKCSVRNVAVSPDHTRLVVDWGEVDWGRKEAPRRFALYDLASGEKRADFVGHTDAIYGLTFSPDGRQVGSSSEDQTARLWDAATGGPLQVLRGHKAKVYTVAYAPDGSRVVTAAADGTIRQWDVATGSQAAPPYRGHRHQAPSAAYSPDGRRIASGGEDGTLRLWDARDLEDVAVLHGHTQLVFHLAFSSDGRRLASAAMDGTARVWEVGPGSTPTVLRGHDSYVYPVAYSPDGRWIASGGWDGTVRLWDAVTREPAAVLHHANRVRALAFGPDSTWLVSGCDDEERLTVWDLATARPRQVIPGPGKTLAALAVSPDGARIAAQDLDGTLRISDAATGQEVASTHLPGRNPETRKETRATLAYSPDGRRLAVVADRSTIGLWDTQSQQLAARWAAHDGPINSLAFSRDGRRLVSAGDDRLVRLWDAATGAPLGELKGHTDAALTAVFHPGGKRVASGGRDQAVLLWDPETGAEVARLHGHTNYVFSLDFSPDGTSLASGSGDFTVRLWDTEALAQRFRARREAEAVRPEAERLVGALFQEGREASEVVRAVRSDPALSEPFRREAQRAVWRRLGATE
jgi:WD40 repeat protein/serine/threonine protein kinase